VGAQYTLSWEGKWRVFVWSLGKEPNPPCGKRGNEMEDGIGFTLSFIGWGEGEFLFRRRSKDSGRPHRELNVVFWAQGGEKQREKVPMNTRLRRKGNQKARAKGAAWPGGKKERELPKGRF